MRFRAWGLGSLSTLVLNPKWFRWFRARFWIWGEFAGASGMGVVNMGTTLRALMGFGV